MHINHASYALLFFSLLFAGAQRPAFPSTIDFENQCPGGVKTTGPCSSLFANAGNAQSLNVPTAIGGVTFQGGALLDNATNLPADETIIYGTAGNAADIGVFPGSGFTNPLTIAFPAPITNFYLDVLNGNTMNVDYHIADNNGNSADFLLAPNLSGGLKTIGFAATGTEVTISAATGQRTPGGMTWDFLIDNVHFDQPLPSGAAPEPGSLALIGIGLAMLALGRIRKKVVRSPAGRFARGSRVLLVSVAGILLVTSASAAATGLTPPALTLSDNYGNSVTIDSTGTATCMGSCTTTMPATASSGGITWAGTLGVFTVGVAGGQSKPALPYAQVNLGLRVTTGAVTGGGGGATNATFNAKWSDVGFDGIGPITMTASYSLSGDVSATYTGYVDNTNALFGTGTAVGTIGPTNFSSTATATGPGPTSEPFSMTEAVTATMGPNSSFTLAGFNLAATPVAQLTLACASASGQVGVSYDSHLMASGGVAPYAFSTVGSIPPGLNLDPSTGEISGTPITPGIFPFTPQVVDASGIPAQNTVQSQCSITITTPPAPLALACPTAADEEGLPYSSSLVATGGIPPYTFSLTSGSLPPGLSLNPSTGAISGIDSTAAGSFSFTAKVLGSSSNAAANAAMSNCLVMAQARTFKMKPAEGTTPQTVVVNTQTGTLLAVVVTDAGTGKPAPAGVTVTFKIDTAGNGPSGAFEGGMTANGINSVDAVTNDKGIATAPKFTANNVIGKYKARAVLAGFDAGTVYFELTNTPGPPANIKATAGDGQTTVVGTQFKNAMTVNVTDRFGNPVPNWPVSFGAPIVPAPGLPAPAPTATFVSNNSPTATVNTDQNGNASSPLVKANTVPGSYVIKAQVSVPLPPSNRINLILSTNFKMTNLAGPPANIVPVLPANDPTVVAGPPVTFFAKVNTKYSVLVVQVTDQYGNPVGGQTVKFKSSNPPREAMLAGATFAGNNSKLGIFCTPPMTGADGIATADPLTANGFTGVVPVVVTVANTPLKKTLDFFNRDTLAPNVVGITQAAATKAITGATLKLGKVTTQSSNTVPAGAVISQDPPAGRPVNFGDNVNLTVSSGK